MRNRVSSSKPKGLDRGEGPVDNARDPGRGRVDKEFGLGEVVVGEDLGVDITLEKRKALELSRRPTKPSREKVLIGCCVIVTCRRSSAAYFSLTTVSKPDVFLLLRQTPHLHYLVSVVEQSPSLGTLTGFTK